MLQAWQLVQPAPPPMQACQAGLTFKGLLLFLIGCLAGVTRLFNELSLNGCSSCERRLCCRRGS